MIRIRPASFSLSVGCTQYLWPILLTVLLGLGASVRGAEPAKTPEPEIHDFWRVYASILTRHFHPDPDHNNHSDLIGLEYNRASGWLAGGATFRHSFGERANYLYAGKRFDHGDYPVYLKLTGGLIEGYRGEYEDKIPLNHPSGLAPAIIPAAGATLYGVVDTEMALLGFAGIIVTLGVRF